jgi:hypothetical protein
MNSKQNLLITAIVMLVLPLVCLAQFETATVLGTVKDPSGAVVPGSQVTLENGMGRRLFQLPRAADQAGEKVCSRPLLLELLHVVQGT